MVTLTNLLEAVKEPQHLQTSLKPREALLLCHTFKELQKESQELLINSILMLPINL